MRHAQFMKTALIKIKLLRNIGELISQGGA